MENKKCSIDGCNRELLAKGFCRMHYNRIRIGNTDTSPNRLSGWGWNKRPAKNEKCRVPDCGLSIFAKGFCRKHYAIVLRNGLNEEGLPIYKKDMPKLMCLVEGCKDISKIKGLCLFHYVRHQNGTDLLRPKGIKGENNPHWKGGVAQYPNHSLMKRVRKEVLKEANYTCCYCGKYANEVHHLDLSKDNHDKKNLVVSCRKCNAQHRKPITNSKYTNIYGKTIKQMAKDLGMSYSSMYYYMKNPPPRSHVMHGELEGVSSNPALPFTKGKQAGM